MTTKIVPISDFIRKFGVYAALLPAIDRLILTREGRPFATVRATPEEKNRELFSFAGLWKGTALDDEKLWKRVRSRRNKPIAALTL